jgi:septal ring factor EnvC (AmiA/AmiB activator)
MPFICLASSFVNQANEKKRADGKDSDDESELAKNIKTIEKEWKEIKEETSERSAEPKAKGETREKLEAKIEKIDQRIACVPVSVPLYVFGQRWPFSRYREDILTTRSLSSFISAAKMTVTDRSEGAEVALGTFVPYSSLTTFLLSLSGRLS